MGTVRLVEQVISKYYSYLKFAIPEDMFLFFSSAIIGLLTLMFFYTLVFYVVLRKKNYLVYLFYSTAAIYFVLNTSGLFGILLSYSSDLFRSVNLILSHVMLYVALSFFIMNIIKLKKNFQHIHKVVQYFNAFPLFLAILPMFEIEITKIILAYFFKIFPILFFLIVLKSFLAKNIWENRYLLFILFYMCLFFVYGISLNTDLSGQNVVKLFLYLGFFFEVIYYSFLIANRIKKYSNDIKILQRRAVLQDIKFHGLLSATFDCFWETDSNGELIFISDDIFEKIEYQKNEIRFNKLEDLFSVKAPNELKIHLRAIMGKKNSFKNIEIIAETKKGEFKWFKVNAIAKIDEFNNFQGYIGALIDETTDRHQQHELFISNNNKSLARMAGSIAHEINNPLTFIFLAVDSIINNPDSLKLDNQNKLIKILLEMKKKGLKISKIVSKLQGFSLQGVDLIKTECKLSTLIEQAIRFCEYELKSSNISIELILEKDEKSVVVKKEEIYKALVNLIHNAIEATENIEFPWIKISLKTLEHDFMEISVMDNGAGIPIDRRASIFEPFYTTKEFKNIGLGLTQSYQFVERNSGTLSLDLNSKYTNFKMQFKVKQN